MKEELPVAAVASGGIYHYRDGRTAPDTIAVLLEYPSDWVATFEATLAPGARGAAQEFVGTNGSLYIDRGRYVWTPAEKGAERVERKPEGQGDSLTQAHVRNFLDCMRSRRRPNGDALVGHRSAVASHLGNIAWLEKRRLVLDPVREEILPG
jgi:predicted dehydrogenase